MNARQKAKKLKKVINMIESDLGISDKWLKIDDIYEIPEEHVWNYERIYVPIHNIYAIRVGSVTAEFDIYTPDKIIYLDTKAYINSIRRRCGLKEE